MAIAQYDWVVLKNGLKACIVELLAGGEMFVADVSEINGWGEDDTIFVMPDEIDGLDAPRTRGDDPSSFSASSHPG